MNSIEILFLAHFSIFSNASCILHYQPIFLLQLHHKTFTHGIFIVIICIEHFKITCVDLGSTINICVACYEFE